MNNIIKKSEIGMLELADAAGKYQCIFQKSSDFLESSKEYKAETFHNGIAVIFHL